MRLSLIAAMGTDGLIGTENGLPWHLSSDLKRFRRITMGKAIIVGRKTLELIGKPLPGRLNIVMTRQVDWVAPQGVVAVHSIRESLELANRHATETGQQEVMIVGGAEIYEMFLPQVETIYLTRVEGEFTGNTYFPSMDWNQWQTTESLAVEEDAYRYRFEVLNRVVGDENRSL
jgi:dihydrofolate reductase